VTAGRGRGGEAGRRVLLIGTFDPTTPRARQWVRLLDRLGCDVTVRNVASWSRDRASVTARSPLRMLPRVVLGLLRCAWHLSTCPRPDLVVFLYPGHVDAIVLGPIARLRRVPAVLDVFVSLYDTIVLDRRLRGPRSPVGRAARAVDVAACRSVRLVVVDTPQHAQFFAALARRSPDRFAVLWVGADEAAFTPTPLPDGGHVLWYGTYIPLHGVETIIRAAADLAPDGHVVRMIGDGQERAAAERLAREVGAANVEFAAPVAESELAREIARASVCLGVFGTTGKTDRVVPNKVFQCAAAARPVVTARTPPVVEAFGDALVTVPAGDAAALAEAIRALDGDARRRAAARARDTFTERFSDEALARDLARILQRVWKPRVARLPAGPLGVPLSVGAWLRFDAIRRGVAQAAPARILEFGAGQGAMGARLARVGGYVGVEPDEQSAGVAARRVAAAGGRVVHGDDVDGGSEPVDLVCAFEVLEHVADDVGELRRWADRLRPGGHVLLSVPAHRARYGAADAAVGHVRRYDRADVERLVREAGLRPRWVVCTGAGLGHLTHVAKNTLSRRYAGTAADAGERTARSGRVLQPSGVVTSVGAYAVAAPFRLLQRPFARTDVGVGFVALAERAG
jgi:glycosyltransferase involved in cell wall biosynthesis